MYHAQRAELDRDGLGWHVDWLQNDDGHVQRNTARSVLHLPMGAVRRIQRPKVCSKNVGRAGA